MNLELDGSSSKASESNRRADAIRDGEPRWVGFDEGIVRLKK